MSENISVTRIMDLPDTFTQDVNGMGQNGMGQNGLGADMYIPMNIHPNPYGMPPPPPGGISPPQQTQTGPTQYANTMYSPVAPGQNGMGQNGMGQNGMSQNGMSQNGMSQNGMSQNDMYAGAQQRLPQRDVPINIAQHMQDEEIQPNYIPKPKVTADYIEEYQETADRKNREHNQKKRKEQAAENWFEELQKPILVALIYFVFQLPIVNTIIFKRFAFLAIYKEDGNFNLTGLTLKCILFGLLYYVVNKTVEIAGNL